MRLVAFTAWALAMTGALLFVAPAPIQAARDSSLPRRADSSEHLVEPDSFEPDDAVSSARPIECNSSQPRTLTPAGDSDWLSLTIPVASQVLIQTFHDGPALRLRFTDDASSQAEEFEFGRINRACGINALPPGTYFVDIDAEAGELAYEVSVICTPCELPNPTPTATSTPTPTPTPIQPDVYEPDGSRNLAKPIACGTTQHRTADTPLDVDWVSFSLSERSQVVLLTTSNDGEYLARTLFAGDQVLEHDHYPWQRLCGENPLEPGTYTSAVANVSFYNDYLEAPTVFPYSLTLACVPCPLPNPTATPTLTPTMPPLPSPTARSADSYEPDDLLILASEISCGEHQTHTFHMDDRNDWFRLRLSEPSQVLVYTEGEVGTDGPPCTEFAGPDYDRSDCWDHPTARVCGVDALSAGDHVFYTEHWGHQGRAYDVTVSCSPCSLPNPPPTPTATNYYWSSGSPTPTPPTADAYEPDGDRESAKPIACGSSQSHTIAGGYESDWVAFDLDSRSQVVLRITGYADVDACLSTSDGDTIESYERQIERVCGVNALEPGRYFVEMNGSTGTYDVALDCIDCDLPNPEPSATPSPYPTLTPIPTDVYEPDNSLTAATRIRCNETQLHTIAPDLDADWMTFVLPERSQVVVTTSRGTHVEMRDSSETVIAQNYRTIARACGGDALSPGAYSLAFSGRYPDETFGYLVTLACSPCDLPNPTPFPSPTSSYPTPASADAYEPDDTPEQARTIECGTLQDRSFAPNGDVDWVSLELPEEAQIVVQASSRPDPDIVIDLENEASDLLASETNLLYRLCGRDALPPGNYRLLLRNFGANEAPRYSVSVTCLTCPPPDPTPTPTPSPSCTPTPTLTSTPAPTPPITGSGEFLCSAGPRDGLPCDSFVHCPMGACVIAQGICSNAFLCDCPSGTCSNASACGGDASFGTCSGGVSPGACCEVALNCVAGDSCIGTQRICVGGKDQGFSCRNNGQCRNGKCVSTGCYCDGGDFDGYTCAANRDCPSGGCTCVPGATPIVSRCTGDCTGDSRVSVDEILRGIQIALGAGPDLESCPSFDNNGDGSVTIDEILSAVSQALNGC